MSGSVDIRNFDAVIDGVIEKHKGTKYAEFLMTLKNELVETYKELVQSNQVPKYKYGQEVWILFDNEPRRASVFQSQEGKYILNGMPTKWMNEEEIYCTREALINAQIEYWQSLHCEDGRHEFCDDASGYKSICIHCDELELQKNSFSPKFEGEIKGFNNQDDKIEKFCKHESDGLVWRKGWTESREYHFHCIKCGEFYR